MSKPIQVELNGTIPVEVPGIHYGCPQIEIINYDTTNYAKGVIEMRADFDEDEVDMNPALLALIGAAGVFVIIALFMVVGWWTLSSA